MRAAAEQAGWEVEIDSCGTAGFHVGSPPDPRSIATAADHGIDINGLQGRQLCAGDFNRFTNIFAMDHSNLANIRAVAPADASAEISLLMDVVSGREGAAISDPYYDGEDRFDETWEDVSAAAEALVERLR